MKKLLGLLLTAHVLYGDIVVSGDDYQVSTNEDNTISLIYTQEHQKEADFTHAFEKEVLENYEKSYGFALDSKLHLGLLSSHNQIANAFSTQIPLNMQMNYIGGAYMVDYMSTTSWLKTLLLHESAHNFQLNPKKNPLSSIAHKIVKNIPFTSLFFVPIFPIPNALESSFLLEGNAVLNESRFNNGGRLYNGAMLAMSITQSRAGYITPKRTYNNHLYFPYGTHHYIVGGFFQLYLAQKYGVDKVNSYFWNFSGQYLPMQTSDIFEQSFGQDYTKELSDYSKWLQNEYSGFQSSEGDIVAISQDHEKLNSSKEEVLFLTSDALSKPELQIISKTDSTHKRHKDNFLFGKVFKVDDAYFTVASSQTEVEKIEMGLFDSKGSVLEKSRSKIIQGLLSDGRFAYFNVSASFDIPALYIGDDFYDHVNSSVFIDDADNIYYFKQDGKKRTLYKNKMPIFSLQSWYGFVTDVNEKGIVFVANSKNGSSLYLYDGEFSRLNLGDDIVDAKLLDDKHVLLATITADGYYYMKSEIAKIKEAPHERSFFFENRDDFKMSHKALEKSFQHKPYESHKHLNYSALSHALVIEEDNIDFSLGAKFSDPLGQNSANIFISRFDEETLAGVGYENSVYRLRYGAGVYGVLEKDPSISSRDFGANLFMNYPLYKAGYQSVDMNLNYHIDHDKDEREPLSLAVNFSDAKGFGKSMYANSKHQFSLFGVKERDDFIGGASYNFFHDLGYEFYVGTGVKYAKSNTDSVDPKHGIELDDNSFAIGNDPSHINMPSIDFDLYAKEVVKGGFSLYKVLNFDAYSFKIPVSLRRESIYAKYNYYDMTLLNDTNIDFSEYILGLNFDLLLLHSNSIPLSFEYIYNEDLRDSSRFRVLFDLNL